MEEEDWQTKLDKQQELCDKIIEDNEKLIKDSAELVRQNDKTMKAYGPMKRETEDQRYIEEKVRDAMKSEMTQAEDAQVV